MWQCAAIGYVGERTADSALYRELQPHAQFKVLRYHNLLTSKIVRLYRLIVPVAAPTFARLVAYTFCAYSSHVVMWHCPFL